MARRGENIRKRSDGRWEGRYIKGRSADGKPRWGYVYGATYTEVREISARKKAEYGIYNLNSTDITFSEISEQWLYSVRQGVKESTFAHYQYTLRHYLQPVFGNFKVSALSEKNSGAGTFGSDNTSQRKAKAFRGNNGTGVLVDAAAHLQVCSTFSSHSPFRDHGKTATKILKSTAAVYHRRTKEITVVRDGFSYAPENRSTAWFSVRAAYRRDLRIEMGRF